MRFLSLAAVFAFASAAHAGVVGTTVMTYVIQNNTGATANSLDVSVDDSPTVTSSPTFSTATPVTDGIDFSGGSVANGSSATFTLEEVGDDLDAPSIFNYNWTSGGTETPVYLNFGVTFSDLQSLALATTNIVDAFDDLYVTQNGSSVLTVPSSGTVGSSELSITNDINMAAGPVDFGFTDTTDGVTVSGTFTAATPEPATTGVCALMLLGIGLVARRRQLRKQ
jgi:hypothetical protein